MAYLQGVGVAAWRGPAICTNTIAIKSEEGYEVDDHGPQHPFSLLVVFSLD